MGVYVQSKKLAVPSKCFCFVHALVLYVAP